jgi:hypothetical protein
MALSYTSQYKYLGHLLTNELRDDNDILTQVRSLYARANMLLRKFRSTQLRTKVLLFNAFCSPIYGCQLWCHFRKDSFNRLRVAYNNALRLLLNIPPWSSASELFVKHDANSFHSVIRKQQYSLLFSLVNSENLIVKDFVESDRFFQSPLMSKWRTDLYI